MPLCSLVFVGLALGNHVVRKPQLPIERPCEEDLKPLAHSPGWSFIFQQNQVASHASEATWKQILQLPTEPPLMKLQRAKMGHPHFILPRLQICEKNKVC
ncbi:unnamed protein product [Pipistrellus nathusii]|uniref:Uncharacterized protein n=1 Tax=Pipistrellus nathusii TaxID=59473 RepID=A0ABN9Z7A8_PIPNA